MGRGGGEAAERRAPQREGAAERGGPQREGARRERGPAERGEAAVREGALSR